ncbi:MAG TPA: hypothetical protein VGG99_03995 [Acetobacteraceae bacterium]|jgi:hypothetical protein
MCTYQITVPTIGCWLQDPMIRLMMDSDHVSDDDMIALLQRVSAAVTSRPAAHPFTQP